MEPFRGEDYLLDTGIARELYLQYAARMPIIDYHCRLDPKELWEDRHFENIAQLWLESDHYKWRLMRSKMYPIKWTRTIKEKLESGHEKGGYVPPKSGQRYG